MFKVRIDDAGRSALPGFSFVETTFEAHQSSRIPWTTNDLFTAPSRSRPTTDERCRLLSARLDADSPACSPGVGPGCIPHAPPAPAQRLFQPKPTTDDHH